MKRYFLVLIFLLPTLLFSTEDQCKKSIYLANPMGFSPLEKSLILPKIVEKLESLDLEVVEPFARYGHLDFTEPGVPYRVGQICLTEVAACDAIFAVINGTPPDEGVLIELAYAMAHGKEIFLFRDDWRRCSDSDIYPLNIMIFSGLPEEGWQDSFFTSLEEITDPNKRLSAFAKE